MKSSMAISTGVGKFIAASNSWHQMTIDAFIPSSLESRIECQALDVKKAVVCQEPVIMFDQKRTKAFFLIAQY
jgi:hypothetical protein